MSIRLATAQLILILTAVAADDTCTGPFGKFLNCMLAQVDNKFQIYQQESSPQVQSSIKTCFSSCWPPDFNNANIHYFLPEPWSGRVQKLLDLLENVDPKVQQCMIDYFKDQASKKALTCIQQYGSPDIKDFQMPPWPSTKSLDISKLKKMALNRMVVWNATLQCGKSTSDNATLQGMLNCVSGARGRQSGDLCNAREKCRAQNVASNACSSRLDSVQKALCTCAREEAKKYSSSEGGSFIESWKQLKETVLQGQMEQTFKQCHTSNNVLYPEEKVVEVKRAIKDSFSDIIKRGSVPAPLIEALSTVAASMRDIIEEWHRAFCSNCRIDHADESEVKRVRLALTRREQNGNNAGGGSPSLGDNLREALGSG